MNSSLSVVIIDDDPGDAALVHEMLSSVRPPIATISATTLAAGMTCIERSRPDAVLLNLGLPGDEGSETFERFHRQHPELATIVLTGLDDPSLHPKLISAGAQDYLVKGRFDAARLATTILHAVERQRLIEERRVSAETAQEVIYRIGDVENVVEDGHLAASQDLIRDGSGPSEQQRALGEALDREQAAADRLRALNEMKSTFLSAVSHELRTPLTTILGFAATLAIRDGELAPELRSEILDRLVSNAHKLDRLVDDLLDVDRLSRGVTNLHVTDTELVSLATTTVEQFEGSAGRVTVSGDAELWARVDASKFERIIENLVANALRHTPPESHVRVSVQGQDGGAAIVVEDDGPGVPDGLKPRIFEPFQQGHEAAASASPGAGIGLALVERFTHCHGGRVTVEDRAGGGARFVVWLPQPARHGQPSPVPMISQHVRTEFLGRLNQPRPSSPRRRQLALRPQRAW